MANFEDTIRKIYGEPGKAWLLNLPNLVKKYAESYHLSALKPAQNLSYNYVLKGMQGDQPIILKLAVDDSGLQTEAAALKAFQGFGAVQLIVEEPGMLLLERADPGNSLKSYFPDQDSEAIAILCPLIQKLHQAPIPASQFFPNIRDWLQVLDQAWDIPLEILKKARNLRDHLLATPLNQALLHGDLHHDNILKQGEGWVVIDPKGVIGESAYELAAFIRNPIPELLAQKGPQKDHQRDPLALIQNRIQLSSKTLGIPRSRIQDWCFVQAVLSWIWNLEDGLDASYFRDLTRVFEKTISF